MSTAPGSSSLNGLIRQSIHRVFEEVNLSTEAWLQKTKLLTVGKERYADFIANTVGVMPLFATSHSVELNDTYVRVGFSTQIERERYRSEKQIVKALKKQARGGSRAAVTAKGKSPLAAIASSRNCFALLGTAGSGKTTAFRHLAVELARGVRLGGELKMPVYLAVRDLERQALNITSAVEQTLEDFGVSEVDRVASALLHSGRLVILLDGLDETTGRRQKRLLDELQESGQGFPAQHFVSAPGRMVWL